MENDSLTKDRIVDLLRFKEARRQGRLEFASDPPPAAPRLATVQPFRPLSARQVAHRQRMAEFLGRARLSS